ncbi:MAG TPA: hypothetical protein VF494_12465 [Candidatus Limnocylindrales bacterium]
MPLAPEAAGNHGSRCGRRRRAAHATAVGPGADAYWEDGNVTTQLLGFNQLNAPGTQGFFEEVVVVRTAWNEDDTPLWQAVYDTWGADAQPTILIEKPLRWASVDATVPFLGCAVGICPTLPSSLDVSEEWTGFGPIERIVHRVDWEREPGVILMTGQDANFFRDADLAEADPFDGALGDLGELVAAELFDVHVAQVFICHAGVTCE